MHICECVAGEKKFDMKAHYVERHGFFALTAKWGYDQVELMMSKEQFIAWRDEMNSVIAWTEQVEIDKLAAQTDAAIDRVVA